MTTADARQASQMGPRMTGLQQNMFGNLLTRHSLKTSFTAYLDGCRSAAATRKSTGLICVGMNISNGSASLRGLAT
jgi:hypothetical protein